MDICPGVRPKHSERQGFLDILFEPFLFLFMQQGFLILVAVSIPTAILSCFIVLKALGFDWGCNFYPIFTWSSACLHIDFRLP